MTVANSENIAEIESPIRPDRRITMRDIADELELSLDRIHLIIREELSWEMSGCVGTDEPKNGATPKKDLCTSNLEIIKRNKHFQDTVITCDETWVYYEDTPVQDEADSSIKGVAKRA